MIVAPEIIIAGEIIVFVAAFVQAVAGFGFGIIAVPMLSLFLPLQQVVPIIPAESLVIGSGILTTALRWLDPKRMWPLFVSGTIAAIPGVWALAFFPQYPLKTTLGILIILTAVAIASNRMPVISHEKTAMTIAGLLSGLLNGIALAGPPVILLLTNQKTERDSFRTNISAYFFLLCLVSVPLFYLSGSANMVTLTLTIWFLPATIAGMVLGILVSKYLPQKTFRRLTLVMTAAMGLVALVSGIRGMLH